MTETRKLGMMAWVGQLVLYGAFAVFIGVFSHRPLYEHLGADQSLIKVSFSHTGQPNGECRAMTAEELGRLPPNMRAPMKCPRERSPVAIEFDLGGKTVLRASAAPSGLSKDGASSLYRRLTVPAGEQQIAVRMNDDARKPGFTYQYEGTVTLAPAQVLVIDFDAEKGRITLR